MSCGYGVQERARLGFGHSGRRVGYLWAKRGPSTQPTLAHHENTGISWQNTELSKSVFVQVHSNQSGEWRIQHGCCGLHRAFRIRAMASLGAQKRKHENGDCVLLAASVDSDASPAVCARSLRRHSADMFTRSRVGDSALRFWEMRARRHGNDLHASARKNTKTTMRA